jgi:uncharacterized membrane protein YeiH
MTQLTLTALLGYIGDVAFVLGGILSAKRKGLGYGVQFLSGLSVATFGGLFIRDWLLLHQAKPSILNDTWEVEMIMATGIIAIAILNRSHAYSSKIKKLGKSLLCILDSVGISGFVAFGYGRGIQAGVSGWIPYATAFATACGGGIIAAVIRSMALDDFHHFKETLAENKLYYIFGVLVSVTYGILYSYNIAADGALLILTGASVIIGLTVEFLKSKL